VLQTKVPYTPADVKRFIKHGLITVENTNSHQGRGYSVSELLVTRQGSKLAHTIQHFQLHGWTREEDFPSPPALCSFLGKVCCYVMTLRSEHVQLA